MGRYNPVAKREYYQSHKQEISEYWKVFYAANSERLKAKQKKKYREKISDYLFYAAKARAAKLGIAFNLTKEDVVIPKQCPVFGHKFIIGHKDWAPSLDRIRPSRGYVRGNVAVISFRANKLKSNASSSELRRLADWLSTFTPPPAKGGERNGEEEERKEEGEVLTYGGAVGGGRRAGIRPKSKTYCNLIPPEGSGVVAVIPIPA